MRQLGNNRDEEKLARAKKRVEEIKGFYTHLTVYIIVNIFILVFSNDIFEDGFSRGIQLELWDFSTAFFWGIGLLIHGLVVFKLKSGFLKNWEERKIREYMEKDREESDKFNDN